MVQRLGFTSGIGINFINLQEDDKDVINAFSHDAINQLIEDEELGDDDSGEFDSYSSDDW